MHISPGCSHFVTMKPDLYSVEPVVVHEMTHGCLSHLPIPAWLNEPAGVRSAAGPTPVNFDVRPHGKPMAYDEHLASRIRKALGRAPGISEKKMFGGIAFLRHGLMFVGVSDSTLMARVGRELYEDSDRKSVV